MSPDAKRRKRVDPWNCRLADFIVADRAMQKCLELARVAARTDIPVLILGETGVGKTLLARAIHNSSKRASKEFVSFNSAALTDTLLDSQLFGHERGAFTGADRTVRGKFEVADGGTLFLDEIADMSPVGQAKILRASEYGEYQRLGSEAMRRADVRLISATHWPIRKFIHADQFRKDLFYRLSGIALTLPPLRERPRELRTLLGAEIALAAGEQGKGIDGLSQKAADKLFAYAWPGNLRELKRVVEVAVAVAEGPIITEDAILLEPLEDHDAPAGTAPTTHPTTQSGDLSLEIAERQHIERVYRMMGGNKRQTARALGISRTTLDRKLGHA